MSQDPKECIGQGGCFDNGIQDSMKNDKGNEKGV